MKSLRPLRLVVSFMLLLAVIILLNFLVETRPGFSYARFFSYFTNQSNILVALFFIIEAWVPIRRDAYDRIRGALILYMSMTSSIYWLFLHQLIHIDSTSAYAANVFLHSGALALLMIDWWFHRPTTRLPKRFFLVWLIYPALYELEIMIAGKFQDWYPYPFFDIDKLGLGKWIIWNGSLAVGIGLVGIGIILIHNRLIKNQ